MKRTNLKLKLHRETLRALTSTELTKVEGAATGTIPCSVATCATECHRVTCRTTC
jgi:hypothetical protein